MVLQSQYSVGKVADTGFRECGHSFWAGHRVTAQVDEFASFHFSTDDLPAHERIAVWREVFSRHVLKIDVTPREEESFRAQLSMLALPGLALSWGQVCAQTSDRTPRLIADGDDDLCLVLPTHGIMEMNQIRSSALIGNGQAILISGAEAGKAVCSDGFSHITLKIPRHELAARVSDIDGEIMRTLGTNSGALRLLCGYLCSMRDEMADFSPDLRQLAVTHVYDLLAAAIGANRDTVDIVQARGVRAARTRDILAAIKSAFAEPSFSPQVLASRLRLSPRYVQDLLHETGTSFTERVLELRLQKARTMLCSGACNRLTVSEIAYACGFNEVSYFNRCFRRRFGAAPSHFRDRDADR
jgi:AraC-like DNA-binding protein